MIAVNCTVNGHGVELMLEPRELALDVLRDHLGLTGTHGGCEQGVCGACTILLDGAVVRSCVLFGVQLEGCDIRTIEGLGAPDALHPVQQALADAHGLQCGFCTPGMVITAVELLERDPAPDRERIRAAMGGNLCRCTGYTAIVDAIAELAQRPAVASQTDVRVSAP